MHVANVFVAQKMFIFNDKLSMFTNHILSQ